MPKVSEENLDLSMIGDFPDHWVEMTLSEVCTQVTDGTHDSPKDVEVGFPLVTGKAIKNRRIDFSIPYNISKQDHEKVIARSKAERDDILFTNIGNSIGDLVRVQSDLDFSIKNVALFKPNQEIINTRFLEYYLFSNQVQSFIKNTTKGSAQPFIGLSSLRGFPVVVPPKEEQNYIAEVLGNLDDKIELNRQTNQTLEQIAQALFKSWFVDFEPVKAKLAAKNTLTLALSQRERGQKSLLAEKQISYHSLSEDVGAQQTSSSLVLRNNLATQQTSSPLPLGEDLGEGALNIIERAAMCAISGKTDAELDQLDPDTLNQLKTTAALFPDTLVDSELGEIPEGWKYSEIGKEVTVVGGGTPSTKNPTFWDEGYHSWTTPKDMSNLTDKILLETDRKITDMGLAKISSGLLPKNTVLMSSRAPVGYLALAKIPVAINQGYIAMRCDGALSSEYVIQWAESVMDEIKQRASGTTFAEISKKNFKLISVLVPEFNVVNAYTEMVSAIYVKITKSLQETQSLTDLRDTLLPKLLSGEIDLTEIT